jgi:RNA polymerase sigma-70 factor (ECF subfamily)
MTDPAMSAPGTTDDVLIRAVADGDRHAMTVLFERHRTKVFRFLMRFVRNQATAEDLTADVFLDVWRNAGRFEGRCSATTWMLAIARFKALSALRARPECGLETASVAQLTDGSEDPEAALAGKRRVKLLQACLERLSFDHREVIDLVYYHEKSIDEVAKITGIPLNTVKTRMFYARKRLAMELNRAGLQRELL